MLSCEASTIRIQPLPVLVQVGQLNDVVAITRHWANGDEGRCRLCDECTADRGVCTVLTEDRSALIGAALYSSRGLAVFGDDEASVFTRPVLGRF